MESIAVMYPMYPNAASSAPESAPTPPDARPRQVLLVEDDESHVEIVCRAFEDLADAFAVTTADHLEAARSLLRQEPFDLIICDWKLPDGEGLELLSDPARPADCPIILMTSQGTQQMAVRALKAGSADYIPKSEATMLGLGLIAERALKDWENLLARRRAEAAMAEAHQALLRRHEELQRFYHIVSHEIKTPLTSAREFISLVLEGMPGPLNPDQQEYLGIALESCDRLGTCINDLLDTTRLDTGKLRLDPKPGSLSQVALQVVASLAPFAHRKSLELTSHIEPDLPQVSMDEGRVVQVISNLVNNAIKFTPADGSISVTVRRMDEPPDRLEVIVRDTGRGIAPESLERIFDRLYQVQSGEWTAEGLGLGLHICRELVRLHGGTLRVESQVGEGSAFFVALPLDPAIQGSAESIR